MTSEPRFGLFEPANLTPTFTPCQESWTLADPFPRDAPLPGAYELHLPADDVTIWYTVTDHEGQEVISVQHVSLDT